MNKHVTCLVLLCVAGCMDQEIEKVKTLSLSVSDHSAVIQVGTEEHSIANAISVVEGKIVGEHVTTIDVFFGKNGVDSFESALKELCAKRGTKLIIHYAPPSFNWPSGSTGQDTRIDIPTVSENIGDGYVRPDK